jgi:DNA-binding protein H-NS
MANIDLAPYKLNDLKRLQLEIENEIQNRQQIELRKAREQILAIARDLGVAVEELVAATPGKQRSNVGAKVKPQYENPADKSKTWSGRGRKPRWLVDALNNGKTLGDLKI